MSGVAILLSGGLLTWWTVVQAARTMRDDLRNQTQKVAQGLNIARVQQLTGTDADLENPACLRIKDQLAAVRLANPLCRFIYLMGRRPDGSIFFYVDSEPAGSKDCSPPGQVYEEASEACRRVFATQKAEIEGPTPDRWGSRVSAMIPIRAPPPGLRASSGGARELLGVLGMDIDARTWNGILVRAALPPSALTLALVFILWVGSTLLSRRARIVGVPPPGMRCLEAALTFMVGLFLTLYAASIACEHAVNEHRQTFEQLASERIESVVEMLRFLRDSELAGLSRFYESSANVTAEEFQFFTAYLTKNPYVQAWEWVPAVPASGKSRFKADAGAAGRSGFEIWQMDAQGKRVPANGREAYYPVYQVAPLEGNEQSLGYDLGSEPRGRAMLEEAVRTGLPTASEPAFLWPGAEKVMLVCRPVIRNGERERVRGFAVGVVRLEGLLRGDESDNVMQQELSLLRKDGTSESLATSWAANAAPRAGLSVVRPFFAFGKTFALATYSGTLPFHPLREYWLAVLSGMVITSSLTAMVSVLLSRRVKGERMLAERKLLAIAIGQASEVVFITSAKGEIQYVNPAFLSLTGYSSEEAIGQNPRILKSGKQDSAFYSAMWETLSNGGIWHGNLINKKKDGTLFTEETTISPIHDALNKIVNYVAVKRDITQELSMQSQLNQAHKMESVGRLAGGVAHDFNNMLCVILGHTEMALAEVDGANPVFGDLTAILSSARRSADLTRQLLAFSRQQPISPNVMNLNGRIEGMLNMLSHLIGEDIRIDTLLDKELWAIKMDPSQIDQIMVNLCVNARDAIADVGTITIETGNGSIDQSFCESHAEAVPGDYVRLAVSDTGCGMDQTAQAHIFEPFYTTKDVGKGTGLGLATVYGIAKQNHGFIYVYSEPGHGATFTIYLPRHIGKVVEPQPPAEPPLRGHETILLVEDEPAIMQMTKVILERLGYTVLAAGSPGGAIRAAASHTERICLLMTDVIMPEMNGRELAKTLLASYPHLKCLFMSGYTSNVITPHGIMDPGMRFIQKPFSMGDLSAKIRETLDA
ncbi:MAG: CHASE domain-containing protein [Verrucomicrobiae bacterium]